MLRHSFDLLKEAIVIENAVNTVLQQGLRTQDIYTDGKQLVSMREMTTAIIEVIAGH